MNKQSLDDEIVTVEYHEEERTQKHENSDYRMDGSRYRSETNSPSNSSEDSITASMLPRKPGRKTDREREEFCQRREWTDLEISQLIHLWKANDVLYNTNHSMYYIQTERKQAMERIVRELGISSKDVNDKMHSLRTYYCSQKQRIESLSNNAVSRWKFYDQMSFLYESVTNRANKNNMNNRALRKRSYNARQEQCGFLTMAKSQSPTNIYTSKEQHPTVTRITDQERQKVMTSMATSDEIYKPYKNSEEKWMSTDTEEIGKLTDVKMPATETGDKLFLNIVARSLSEIPEGQEKEKLKLDIQTMIFNTRYQKTMH